LPEQSPQRFQFNLKHLLAYMFASAIVAAALRPLAPLVTSLPELEQAGWVTWTLCGLAFGGLLYFFIRGPFLLVGAGRASRRWREIQKHRRDLEAWGDARKRERSAGPTDVPPAE
jgi:hypothetical protein